MAVLRLKSPAIQLVARCQRCFASCLLPWLTSTDAQLSTDTMQSWALDNKYYKQNQCNSNNILQATVICWHLCTISCAVCRLCKY